MQGGGLLGGAGPQQPGLPLPTSALPPSSPGSPQLHGHGSSAGAAQPSREPLLGLCQYQGRLLPVLLRQAPVPCCPS